jgi:hypothetical protein
MAQIMNAGTVPMPSELFRRAQPYDLADGGKVVSGTAVGDALAVIRHEERFRRSAEKPIPFLGIGNEPDRGAFGERQQSSLSEFPASQCDQPGFQIDISRVERERLADPEAGHGDETEQRRAGQRADAVDRRQFPGCFNDAPPRVTVA